MLKEERLRFILESLERVPFVKVSAIAKSTGVTEMTIRRDIDELAKNNHLIKIHGGAKKINAVINEKSTNEKYTLEVDKKREIGRILNSYIEDNSVLYLAAGTTIYYSLPFLDKDHLKIVTNSLICFDYLINHTNYDVNLAAGEYIRRTSEFVGDYTESFFEHLNIDMAFFATNGIYNDNATTSSSKRSTLQRKIFDCSKQTFVVADSTKFNKSDMYTFCSLSELDGIVTDSAISKDDYKQYSRYTKIINKERSI